MGASSLSNYGYSQPAPQAELTQLGKEKGRSSEIRTLDPVL